MTGPQGDNENERGNENEGDSTPPGGIKPLKFTDPTRIGPYLLLGRLGAGGMGRVYLARTEGGRTVAVKVVHEEHVQDPRFRARFRREVDAARRVDERYTAPVLEADPDAETPWVATGYVPGLSLEHVVRDHGPLPADSVRRLAVGLLHALADIHEAGVVHRDLKPPNVMVTMSGPKVIDFGIASAVQASVEALLTSTNMVIGSPGFMSPEQIRGEQVGPKTDVFTLGCVLMYAATASLPFGRDLSNQLSVMYRVANDEPDLDAVEDPELRALIARCLIKDEAERPAVTALLADLEGTPEPGRSPVWLPNDVVARLAVQSAALLDAEAEPVREPAPADRMTIDLSPAPAATAPSEPGRRKRAVTLLLPAVVVVAVTTTTVLTLQPFARDDSDRGAPPATTGPATPGVTSPTPSEASPSRTGNKDDGKAKDKNKDRAGDKQGGGDEENADQGAGGAAGATGAQGGGADSGGDTSSSAGSGTDSGSGSGSGGTSSSGSTSTSGGSSGGTSGSGSGGTTGSVPAAFVGTWKLDEVYNQGVAGTVTITSAGTVRYRDFVYNNCPYDAKVTSVSASGSSISVGASHLVGSNPGYCWTPTQASTFTKTSGGLVQRLSNADYHYKRA
ncbi:serine/threonine-protein kinase [Streptomyces xanthii]|uniref:Serine/threonine protein kinase n=1 Tax=Streptomyces xanthii TaxID=2768069 RepID=A0A7H1B7W4_9ACTN|nr:serine/threonine-protein kinase [Streptomyces xanthii]QNS04819.1 serine/threonine protein kinase [Streptomyces xanthii]